MTWLEYCISIVLIIYFIFGGEADLNLLLQNLLFKHIQKSTLR